MKTPVKILAAIGLAAILLAIYLPSLFLTDEKMFERTGLAMGTVIEVKIPYRAGEDTGRLDEAAGKALAEAERVERLFSVYKDDSEISRINHLTAGEPLAIDPEVYRLIARSIEYSKTTDGAFDITVGPLTRLWSSARSSGKLPGEAAVAAALEKVGYYNIVLDSARTSIAFLKDGMSLDMGGVAKGYATDRAVEVLKDNGVTSAIVNMGGDLYCLGRRSPTTQWTIGIRHPRDKKKLFMQVDLRDRAVDTSGDYEKFFTVAGKRYSHIIDPRTGYPAASGVVSASVIDKSAAAADMLATALCVLGRPGLAAVETEEAAAVMVTEQGGVLAVETAGSERKRFTIDRTKLL